MNRREWLRNAALIAGGVLAADQIELIEKLTPRNYVTGFDRSFKVRIGTTEQIPVFANYELKDGLFVFKGFDKLKLEKSNNMVIFTSNKILYT